LESVIGGEYLGGALHVLAGSEADSVAHTYQTSVFERLLTSRPHSIWRAVLDTEVFAVQTPDECMTRLALDTTRPEDRMIVYSQLRKLGPPRSVHNDGGEVLTGVLPLPVRAGMPVILRRVGRTTAPRPRMGA